MNYPLAVFAAAMIALLSLSSSPVAAQSCPLCQDGEVEGQDAHQFMSFLGASYNCEPGSYGCHSFPVANSCHDYHEQCKPSEDAEDAIEMALSEGSPALLQKALSEYASLVTIVGSSTLRLINCSNEFVADFALPTWALSALRL